MQETYIFLPLDVRNQYAESVVILRCSVRCVVTVLSEIINGYSYS